MTHPANKKTHVPERTCVGCRTVDEQPRLRRVTADAAGRLRFDPGAARQPGRGAYVHPQQKCLEAALARGGFARSFRRKVLQLVHEAQE